MNYIKAGFGLAVGWQLGEVMFEAVGVAIRYYVPEKYWNKHHPDYPGRRKTPPPRTMRRMEQK